MAFTDSTGRQVLAVTGPGNSGGDQILVSGLGGTTPSPITVNWTTTNVTFPESYSVASGSSSCTLLNGLTGQTSPYTLPVVSSIVLPNGESYSFTYDSTYGKVSKITFPDGGYVRYVWGLNPLSQSTTANWTTMGYNGYSPDPVSCTIAFDTPAITDRYVSFNGTTEGEVLHQQFCYTTNWGAGSTPCTTPTLSGSYVWTSKTTVVTTTDSVTGQVDKTTYYCSRPLRNLRPIPYGGGLGDSNPN